MSEPITFNDGGVARKPKAEKPEAAPKAVATGFVVYGAKGQDITLLFNFMVNRNGVLFWETPVGGWKKYESPHKVVFI